MFSTVSTGHDYMRFPSLPEAYAGVNTWQNESFAFLAVLATIEMGNRSSGGHGDSSGKSSIGRSAFYVFLHRSSSELESSPDLLSCKLLIFPQFLRFLLQRITKLSSG